MEVIKIKELSRRDRNGTRTSEELRRRYRFEQIDYTQEEIDELKKKIITDDHLSNTSTNPVQNKVITEALNNKVNKENGKGLSSNDFTDELKNKLENQTIPTKVSELENDLYYATEDLIPTKVSELTNDSEYVTQDKMEEEIRNNSHSHDNKTILDGITDDNIKEWNNLAVYENGGTTDANTTTERLVLTKVNAPTTDFWYIETLFYGSISNTSNRKQIAYGYKFDAPIYTRYFVSGAWSEWKSILEESDKSYNLSSYKVSALTILRSSCVEKNKRVVMDFVGTITMAANTTTVLFNLPEAIRPTQIKDFIVFGQTNNDDGYIGYGQISTTGSLQVRFNTAISSYIRFSVVYDLD